jgi:hypothetical protein
MKKTIIVLFILAVISPVFAQSNSGNEANMYVINVDIEKIYPSSMGYIVQYQKKSGIGIGTVGIPNEWFTAAGKAEYLSLPHGVNWPSMSVFFNNGEFSHVRLYVHWFKGHQTWGNIPLGVDITRHFKSTDTLDVEF